MVIGPYPTTQKYFSKGQKGLRLEPFSIPLKKGYQKLKRINSSFAKTIPLIIKIESLTMKKLLSSRQLIINLKPHELRKLKGLLKKIIKSTNGRQYQKFKEFIISRDKSLTSFMEREKWNSRASLYSTPSLDYKESGFDFYTGEQIIKYIDLIQNLSIEEYQLIETTKGNFLEQPSRIKEYVNLLTYEMTILNMNIYSLELISSMILRKDLEKINAQIATSKIIDVYNIPNVGFHLIGRRGTYEGLPLIELLNNIFKNGLWSEMYGKFSQIKTGKNQFQASYDGYSDPRVVSIYNIALSMKLWNTYLNSLEKMNEVELKTERKRIEDLSDLRLRNMMDLLIDSRLEGKSLEDQKEGYEKIFKSYKSLKKKYQYEFKGLGLGGGRPFGAIISPKFPYSVRKSLFGKQPGEVVVKYRIPSEYLIGLLVNLEAKKEEQNLALKICKFFAIPLYDFEGRVIWPK